MQIHARLFLSSAVGTLVLASSSVAQGSQGGPLKLAPRPTSAAISEADLRTRLYIFADDSMLGRRSGTIGNQKATDYIAAELRRLGLEPAGENGTYFQPLRYGFRAFAPGSRITVGGQALEWGRDVAPAQMGAAASLFLDNVQVVFGGVAGDTARQIAPAVAVGRIVVLVSGADAAVVAAASNAAGRGGRAGGRGGAAPPDSVRARLDSLAVMIARLEDQARLIMAASAGRGGVPAGGGRGGRAGFGANVAARFPGAVAVVTADLDQLSLAQREALVAPPTVASLLPAPPPPPSPGQPLGPAVAPVALRVTREAAERLMGVPLGNLPLGAAGRTANIRLDVTERLTPEYGRNVVAILRGSDPTLQAEYVSIGAHNDHIGWTNRPVNHDSARAVASELYKLQMADGRTLRQATVEMRAAAEAAANTEANRRRWSSRLDSISNGADDDGSGSMAVLEIAEAFALSRERPKRSILFIWHTGEEGGLSGSAYYVANPTVPREAIVANINLDMIGRGRPDDIIGGGPDYLAVVGSTRLSSDLGRMVVEVNQKQRRPLKLDYQFDEQTEWAGYNNIYGRSDHANYARYGIPIAFFFTGLHRDYHQVTDEPQYIDYPHYTRITNYIRDLVAEVANAPQRPRVDRPVQ